jgi:hypothetical protein
MNHKNRLEGITVTTISLGEGTGAYKESTIQKHQRTICIYVTSSTALELGA